jgi:hypothetical protein
MKTKAILVKEVPKVVPDNMDITAVEYSCRVLHLKIK